MNNENEGITMYECISNTITGNTISKNKNGILIDKSSDNNRIKANKINSNTEYGLHLSRLSRDNIIWHNNFLDNGVNAYVDTLAKNIWDDGKYGNYWSDYKEKYPDAKKIWLKGIWDTPYEIPGKYERDNYPLIFQWPDSKTKTLTRNTSIDKTYMLRFFNLFTILHRILDLIKQNSRLIHLISYYFPQIFYSNHVYM
jgi:parallel beta-helix repeat protein